MAGQERPHLSRAPRGAAHPLAPIADQRRDGLGPVPTSGAVLGALPVGHAQRVQQQECEVLVKGVAVAARSPGKGGCRVGEESAHARGELAAGQLLDVDLPEREVGFCRLPAGFVVEESESDFPGVPAVLAHA